MECKPFDQYSVKVDGSGRITTRNRQFLRLYTLPPHMVRTNRSLNYHPVDRAEPSAKHQTNFPPRNYHSDSGNDLCSFPAGVQQTSLNNQVPPPKACVAPAQINVKDPTPVLLESECSMQPSEADSTLVPTVASESMPPSKVEPACSVDNKQYPKRSRKPPFEIQCCRWYLGLVFVL